MKQLPPIATKLVNLFGGWIVGSAATPNAKLLELRDIDILIPYNNWQQAVALVPKDSIPNTFGGWKFKDSNISIDVWPADLDWFITNMRPIFLWNPKSNIRLGQI